MSIMQACLKCGAAYIDMAQGQTRTQTIDEAYLDQMTLAPEFAKAGLLALLSTGMDPGVTNTFAANGYEDLDKCFEIRIKDYALFDSPGAAAGLVAGDLLHRLRAAAAALRGRRVQARRDLRPPRALRVPRAVRPRHRASATTTKRSARCRACCPRSSATRACATSTSRWAATRGSGIDADLALVGSGMTSKYPVTLKDGTEVRPIDVFVATLPPNPPADELAKLALAGEITDYRRRHRRLHRREGRQAGQHRLQHLPAGHQVGQRPDPRRHLRAATAPARRPASTPSSSSRTRSPTKGMICPEELAAQRARRRSSPSSACATCRSRARTSSPPTEPRDRSP